ncbi:hypothetical protein BS78_01G141200 [Paspalum vaginatum]|nr:hypothetical protein BS78_01G141200 [Paspalum vaginatum]
MSALQIPRSVIKAIDGKRRAFFWTGEDKCHVSKCLVAWQEVCKSKAEGGLGLKSLEMQNQCLLMKFVDKVLDSSPAPWKDWVCRENTLLDGSGTSPPSFLWRILNDELDRYRSCTLVVLGNGASTSFWFDRWFHDKPLAQSFPSLFSHVQGPNVTVQFVLQHNFELHLRPRLTSAAEAELTSLLQMLEQVQLSDSPDERKMHLSATPFSSRCAYSMLVDSSSNDANGLRVWKTRMPNKVKVFAWLFFRDRLSTWANLHKKHVQPEATCSRCGSASESWHHAFIQCPFIVDLWARLGVDLTAVQETDDLWTIDPPSTLGSEHWSSVLLAILWRLWEARNNHVFRAERSCVRVVLSRISDDLKIWRHRFPVHARAGLDEWRTFLVTCNYNSATASTLDALE